MGAGLLAKAVYQPTSMLAVMTPSRASSLPQGLVGVRKICEQPGLLWEPAREGGGSADINAGCNGAFASRLAPTGLVGVRNICEQPGLLWEPAREGGGSASINVECAGLIAGSPLPQG